MAPLATLAAQLPTFVIICISVLLALIVALAVLALLPGPLGRRAIKVLETLLRITKTSK